MVTTQSGLNTREQWLNTLAQKFRAVFADMAPAFPLPDKIRISVGWPSTRALSAKKRVIGQCWSPECSTDGATEIFISPFLGDGYQAAETLLHEMIHAAGCHGHKGAFVRCAKLLGFTAPWTSTPASEDLKARIQGVVDEMPEYPHATLDATAMAKLAKKQTTRLLKAKCATCDYTVRVTRKWVEDKGAPICPCNKESMVVDMPEGEDDDGEEGTESDRVAA